MENKTIEQLLNSLSALVSDARGSLFGQDKVMVDRDQLLYLVDALQAQLPAELEESKAIIQSCNALRNNAKQDAAETRRQADQVLKDAQERAAKLIEQETIVMLAEKRRDEIVAETEQQRAELISGALNYADRILAETQQTIARSMETLGAGVAALQSNAQEHFNVSLQGLEEARSKMKSASENP